MKPSEGGELGDITFEPTSSKAKEMRRQQCLLSRPVASSTKAGMKLYKKLFEEGCSDESSDDEDSGREEELPWPVASPTKTAENLYSKLLVEEFPDETADEDYRPEEEAHKIARHSRSKFCSPSEEVEELFSAPGITFDMWETECSDEMYHNFLSELMKPIDSTGTIDHLDDAENDPEVYILKEENLRCCTLETKQNSKNTPSFIWMTSDERIQLDEQLRMYVQLLTQSHLLSHGNPVLKSLNELTKTLLVEMKMFATRERASTDRSAFYAHNLDGALDIVKKFEDVKLPSNLINTKLTKAIPPVPPHIHRTLASSKAFIYPELLPKRGFRNTIELGNTFNTPEDNLIALGLEQFKGLGNSVECIHKYLIPVKGVGRIMTRIKNCQTKYKPLDNSIKFYQKFKQAPKFHKVIRIFDPDNVKSPKDYAPDVLPEWMESFSKFSTSNPVTPRSVLAPSQTPSTEATLPPFRKALKPRKYARILPRGVYIHPPHYIKPTHKKYSKKRPYSPSICDSKSPYRPPTLKLKPLPYDSSEL